MNKIEQLIVKFKKAQEELSKTINESYGTSPNEVAMSEHACKGEGCDHDMHKGEAAKKMKQAGVHAGENPQVPGRSVMGVLNSLNATKEAKSEAKRVLGEIKSMPKLKLVKSEERLSFDQLGQWTLNKSEAVSADDALNKGYKVSLTPAAGVDFSAPPLSASPEVAKNWSKLPKEVQHWFHAHHAQQDASNKEADSSSSKTKTMAVETKNK